MSLNGGSGTWKAGGSDEEFESLELRRNGCCEHETAADILLFSYIVMARWGDRGACKSGGTTAVCKSGGSTARMLTWSDQKLWCLCRSMQIVLHDCHYYSFMLSWFRQALCAKAVGRPLRMQQRWEDRLVQKRWEDRWVQKRWEDRCWACGSGGKTASVCKSVCRTS